MGGGGVKINLNSKLQADTVVIILQYLAVSDLPVCPLTVPKISPLKKKTSCVYRGDDIGAATELSR